MGEKKIITYKGTDKDMKCHGGFQYKLGKKYEDDGAIRCGKKGFHSCEVPLDTLSYFAPDGDNRFFSCEIGGEIAKGIDDSKVASSEIKLKTEIGIAGLIKAQIEYVKKWAKDNIAQGDRGHSVAQGDSGHSVAQGYRGHSEVHGRESIAAALGPEGKALGEISDWLVLAEWEFIDFGWKIKTVKTVLVDGKKIKPKTWYILKDGEFIETDGEY